MNRLCLLFFILVGLMNCQQEKLDYDSWLAKESKKTERVDTLFHGLYFGMPQQEFYTQCWELNKKGILTDGNGNATARFRLETELDYGANYQFYPNFLDGKIAGMACFVEYDKWAPWNKHLFSIQLIEELKDLMDNWYGIKFVPIKSPSSYGKAYLGIKSNLKIVLYYKNDNQVEVAMYDLSQGNDEPNEIL